ncbi:Hsp20/alpha crystallin family protein [Bacillus atrophaeus]|uniref:Hsp20/alpha crystallin family protein n=1 Tax=Bacillus atrophaeus TaxID=1452 RepID=UPI00228329F8|nr:Hsp20/alpha crystallin family protein [Bacillus atrophaeus]MCY8959902.1 Hsp20/alpha crystallin family protein [Bacillus atrophaeus]MCY8963609.1 Hsp20/alpha crystallin family protein [Bacillus atrophaeus]MCY9437307.1 Hsp20/alpha crystallin family protein [Bacillus atrophaeus]MEC0648652.1 Hsp20/alpha crystallin family protein [Bacillus atrophaeus]
MSFSEDKENELQKKEEHMKHALDQFFHSSPFEELLNSFQHLVNSSLTEAQVTMNVREEHSGLFVDIDIPPSFKDGDILVEAKSRYLHITLRQNHQEASSATHTSMTRTVLLPYEVQQELMNTSWNEQTMTLFFPKNKHE